jgi:TIR domain
MNEPTDKLFDVFLSYSRTDETWVVRLKSALVERGFQVWVDRDDIQAGERFVRAIESAMKTSALWRWWRARGESPHRESRRHICLRKT